MDIPVWVWASFIAGVMGLLALDLGVFHRKAHEVTIKEAATWTGIWVTLGLLFAAGVFLFWPDPALRQQKGIEWLTGYLIEYSLAVDNIFVFVLVFSGFAVPPQYRHRVLFWGIIGALLMRGAMIAAGAALIDQFHWILYVFGGFLLFTGIRMLLLAFSSKKDEHVDLEKNPAIKLARRFFKISSDYDGQKFFTVQNGVRMATPLFLVLVMIEFTDLVFAVDSIPAIFAVTRDPFIVFTSNVMAILGLRSMYFLLADIVDRFVYLKTGLAVILSFIGTKLLLLDVYKIPTAISLAVVVGVLAISIVASLLKTRSEPPLKEKPAT
jgi:tellurite resistance protein TerC